MIKIEKVNREVSYERPAYPRIMTSDLNNGLVFALYKKDDIIHYTPLHGEASSVKSIESHHLHDFEGSITIRNDR